MAARGGGISISWARPLLLVIVAVLALIATMHDHGRSQTAVQTVLPTNSDQKLYRQIAASVRAGNDYYSVAVALQRKGHYPVRPFFTVRMPVLAWFQALVGEAGLRMVAVAGTLAVIAFWLWRLGAHSVAVRLAGCGVVAAVSVPLAWSPFIFFHDYWAGLCLSFALGLRSTAGRAAFGLLAALVRELTVPFLAIEALLVLLRRRNFAAATWPIAALAIAVVAIASHAAAVMMVTTAHDHVSAGWGGMRGPAAVADDLASLTVLQFLPWPLVSALVFAPLLGWYEADDHRVAFGWYAFFTAVIVVFSRTDNIYWAACILPAYFVGLVFVPAFVRKTWRDLSAIVARPG